MKFNLKTYTNQVTKFGKTRVNAKTNSDEEEMEQEVDQLGYYVMSHSIYQYMVPVDTAFIQPSYYRGVAQILMNAGEDDSVVFTINTPGGALSGLLTMINSVETTAANTVALIVGEASSAGSMFALMCNEVYVSENATMLCHNVSYGTNGKGSDVLAHVQHTSKTATKLLRKCYKDFLSEAEVEELINGKEIYLDADEIIERLELREKIREERAEQEEKELAELEVEPEVEPEVVVVKPKAKKKPNK